MVGAKYCVEIWFNGAFWEIYFETQTKFLEKGKYIHRDNFEGVLEVLKEHENYLKEE